MTEAAQTETAELVITVHYDSFDGKTYHYVSVERAKDLLHRLHASQESLRAMTAERDEARSSLASLADVVNQEIRENGPHTDQAGLLDDLRPFVRRLVDYVRNGRETAERELEACRLDAERYRWLRDVCSAGTRDDILLFTGPDNYADDVDAAIDAARQAGA